MIAPIIALFCDGGVIGANPSTIGATYAWCGVSRDGEHVREVAGYLLPGSHPAPGWARVASTEVTNNESEFFAALCALEAMRPGWSGQLVTDSQVTLDRLERACAGVRLSAFRPAWEERLRKAFAKLGVVRLRKVAGHPTLAELAQGYHVASDGSHVVVSRHQCWCDDQCSLLAREHATRLAPDYAMARAA